MLLHIPQVLTPDEIAQARAWLADAAWADGRLSAGPQAAGVKHNQQLAADSPALAPLRSLVLAALDRHALFFSAALPKRLLPPQFNRYAGAHNHYGNHVDQAIRQAGAGQRLRSDLSCTLFLTPPEDYDGGELVIANAPGAGGLAQQRIKLAAGDALLYPGSSVHRVEPVTRGERLACFFWIESLVRSAEQRDLLFDMDLALMQLRQRHGEDAATVSLTGSYHNLLRLWADT